MRAVLLSLLAGLSSNLVFAQTLPENFIIENAVSGETFKLAVGMAFAPDGRFFVIEQRGRVYLVEKGIKQEPPFLDLENEVFNVGEMGLLGIAVDPDFNSNGFIYLQYSVDPNQDGIDHEDEGTFQRLTRFTANPDKPGEGDLSSRFVLIGTEWSNGIPLCHLSHAGGAIRFGSDGTLLLSTGDGSSFFGTDIGGDTPNCFGPGKIDSAQDIGRFRAQTTRSFSGKILRIDPETGLGLPSNPYFTGESTDVRSKVWAYGLRNPFRFTIRNNGSPDPDAGQPGSLYIGDVGANLFEELHVSTAGGENFGWPCYQGLQTTALTDSSRCTNTGSFENPQSHTTPVVYVHHSDAAQSFPTGMTGHVIIAGTFYTGLNYPHEYQGGFFFADYVNGWLKFLRVDQNDHFLELVDFAQLSQYSVVDMQSHPVTGDLYFVHLSHQTVYRLKYDKTVSVPDALTVPTAFVLSQNYPNPFNPRTVISYQIAADSEVELTVHNQLGQEVRTLVKEKKPAGAYKVEWDARDNKGKQVVSGVYFYRLKAGSFAETRKLILMR